MFRESSLSDTNGWLFLFKAFMPVNLHSYIIIINLRLNGIFFNKMKKNVKVVDNLCLCVIWK